MNDPALEVDRLVMRFAGEADDLFAIAALQLPAGASLGIAGPSGAGKTTLFNLLAGIERPAGGSIRWHDADICRLGEAERDRWRRANLGLVFQDFHLLDGLSALDNVLLPVSFGQWRADDRQRRRAALLLDRVGLNETRRPAALLSRGERQRVALARALLLSPRALLADEPTASLDPHHRQLAGELLVELAREVGATLIVVSHEQALLDRLDRRCELSGGRLREL